MIDQEEFFPIKKLILGLVHNLSNPLTIIKVRTQLLQKKYPNESSFNTILEKVDEIITALDNLAIKFNREQASKDEAIDLNELLKIELTYLIADLEFKHSVGRDLNLQPNLPLIHGNYYKISQGILGAILASILNMQNISNKKLAIYTLSLDNDCLLNIYNNGNLLTPEEIETFNNLLHDTKSFVNPNTPKFPIIQSLQKSYALLESYIESFSLSSASPVGMYISITFKTTGKNAQP